MATVTRKPKTHTQVIRTQDERPGLLRRIFTPKLLIALGVIALVFVSVFVFFYVKYSRMIDARLAGDVLVRSAGIYAAPRTIKVEQQMTIPALKGYLDSIGYVESSKDADSNRGRYQIKGNSVEIFSSAAALVNNRRQFPNILVAFGAGGKSITKITDLDTKRNLDITQLEPEMLTSISGDKGRKQKLVTFKDLPKDLVNAVLAIEDRQFFEHSGINFRGIARALWRDASEGQLQEGGSSITQQLVKNFFLTPERTFRRKVEEMMIAFTLETKLEKEEIFQLYANEIFMGQNGSYSVNGFGEAATFYFNKEVMNLTLPESAFLAGIIRGPSLYSPHKDPARAKARRNQVLDSMTEAGFITRESAEQAKATELKIQPRRNAINSDAPYFVDYLQQYLSDEKTAADLARQSYRVYTTVDMELQRAADKALNETLAKLDQTFARRKKDPIPAGTLQAALVAVNAETGEIVAMVGGRDYSQSQLNRAIEANRQPGSVFKPIVYATALNSAFDETADEKITAATTFLDAPETFLYGGGKTYSPENFGKTYSNRPVTMREALVHSLNVVTVRVAEKAGYNRVARMAEKLGLPRPQSLPSTALGAAEATPLQIASAYTAFANNGRRAEATPIKRVTNSDGVAIIEPKPHLNDALRPQVSWILTNIMQDVLNRGTAARARAMGFTATAAGKTGTSRDGWFAGFTPNLVCAVWVGFDDNRELGIEGSKSALPIWTAFMKEALAKRPDLGGNNFPKPEGVVEAEVDPTTGKLWTDACPEKRADYFIEGTQPQEECDVHAGDFIPLPDFEWPETSGIRDRAKEMVREAERAVDDLGRKMRREIKKAIENP